MVVEPWPRTRFTWRGNIIYSMQSPYSSSIFLTENFKIWIRSSFKIRCHFKSWFSPNKVSRRHGCRFQSVGHLREKLTECICNHRLTTCSWSIYVEYRACSRICIDLFGYIFLIAAVMSVLIDNSDVQWIMQMHLRTQECFLEGQGQVWRPATPPCTPCLVLDALNGALPF